ncbi:hypothetical protein BV898_14372 [Hypsibius exemplaris]|uniref:Uncharacterized protein n=1 Tax=Hypsibius exemplaris TaxID=2072580 RepID=A0A9X6RJF6_HYPEX|nr:hypothetical protein BV898_14372 [Hypsibius exemplaris]
MRMPHARVVVKISGGGNVALHQAFKSSLPIPSLPIHQQSRRIQGAKFFLLIEIPQRSWPRESTTSIKRYEMGDCRLKNVPGWHGCLEGGLERWKTQRGSPSLRCINCI